MTMREGTAYSIVICEAYEACSVLLCAAHKFNPRVFPSFRHFYLVAFRNCLSMNEVLRRFYIVNWTLTPDLRKRNHDGQEGQSSRDAEKNRCQMLRLLTVLVDRGASKGEGRCQQNSERLVGHMITYSSKVILSYVKEKGPSCRPTDVLSPRMLRPDTMIWIVCRQTQVSLASISRSCRYNMKSLREVFLDLRMLRTLDDTSRAMIGQFFTGSVICWSTIATFP